MLPDLSSPPSARKSRARLRPAASVLIAATLLLVAWGCFAFGAVYPWAFLPLTAGSALVGVIGIWRGDRPAWKPHRGLMLALLAIWAIGALQLIPLPLSALSRVSPGTVDYLSNIDLRFALAANPATNTGPVALWHPVSIEPAKTLLFLQLFAALILLLAGLLRTLSRTAALRLARGIVFIGFVLAIVGILQKAILGDHAFAGMRIYGFWEPEHRLTTPFGPFVNKNHFAGWMLMGIPVALGLALSQMQQTRRRVSARELLVWASEPEGGRMLLYLVAALVMAMSLLMTGSRSGIGCLALTLLAIAYGAGRETSRRTALWIGAGALILFAGALQWAGADARLGRFVADQESLGMRLAIWRICAGIVPHFPLFGSGMDTFGSLMIRYQTAGDLHYQEAHNDYVQLLVEGGVITFALLLAAIVAAAAAVTRRFRADDDGGEARWIRRGAAVGLLAIELQAGVEFSLQMPGNAVLFVVLLSIALYVPAPHRHAPAQH